MPLIDVVQIVLLVALVVAAAKPVGTFLFRLYSGERTCLHPVLAPVERAIYRVAGVDPSGEMTWVAYALSMLMFSGVCVLVLFAVLRLQGYLPLNPAGVPSMPSLLALNTAVSFVTNTNWQAYSGESGVSYLTQMVGLAWQNFISAGVGMAVAVAFVRGLTRAGRREIGNFWVDLTRSFLYVFLPLSLVLSVMFVSQGVIDNFKAPTQVKTVEGASQTIAQGPVASQEAIKELGTNGGGFFNANSAHPFENPTPLTNLLQVFAILSIPAGLAYMVGQVRGGHSARMGATGRHDDPVLHRSSDDLLVRAHRQPQHHQGRRDASRDRGEFGREHGGQGGPLRHRTDVGVRELDHRGIVRSGQCESGQSHAACRRHGDAQHRARRDRIRWGRLGPVRHAHLRDLGGVHRGTDGGQDARVPRQEDRADRHEARDALGTRS